jgi:hypothetical protein
MKSLRIVSMQMNNMIAQWIIVKARCVKLLALRQHILKPAVFTVRTTDDYWIKRLRTKR